MIVNYFAAGLVAASSIWLLRTPNRPPPVRVPAPPIGADGEGDSGQSPAAVVAEAQDEMGKKIMRALLVENTRRRQRDDGSISETVRSALVLGDGETRLAQADEQVPIAGVARSLGERTIAGIPCVGSLLSLARSTNSSRAVGDDTLEEWRAKADHRLVRRIYSQRGGAEIEAADYYLLAPGPSAAMLKRAVKGQL